MIDHLKYAITNLGFDHSLIAADNLVDSSVILGSEGIKVYFHNILTNVDVHFYGNNHTWDSSWIIKLSLVFICS